MKSKFTLFSGLISPILIIALSLLFSSCKKDQLKIDREKTFLEADFKFNPEWPYNGGWKVTLKPNDLATVVPGGDIIWGGTYKISGKLLTVNADGQTYKFEILSETDIKEKTSGVILRLTDN